MRAVFMALIIFCAMSCVVEGKSSFKTQQLKHKRVSSAFREKEGIVKKYFDRAGVEYPPEKIFIRIFKTVIDDGAGSSDGSGEVQLWAMGKSDKEFKYIKSYRICSSSGELGPKLKQGDGQVPEGFYEITNFNPQSNFYLSQKVSYPNKHDIKAGDKDDPGGDIYIHGNCVTIGCIPITDDYIKELYVAAVSTKVSGHPIYCHIFPMEMNNEGMRRLKKLAGEDKTKIRFWENLKEGYDIFENTRIPPVPTFNKNGAYVFKMN